MKHHLILVLIATLLAGCGSGVDGGAPRTVVTTPAPITATPPAVATSSNGSIDVLLQAASGGILSEGAIDVTLHFTADDGSEALSPPTYARAGLYAQEVLVTDVPPGTWSLLVVATDEQGHAVDLGHAVVTSTAGAVTGTRVAMGLSLTSLDVTPPSTTLQVEGTQPYAATAVLSDGATFTVTAMTAWSADPAEVATVDESGLATAAGVGTASVQGDFYGTTATASLDVAAPPTPATEAQGAP